MVEKFSRPVDPNELTDRQREFVDSVHIGLTLEDDGQYKVEREVNHTVPPSEFEDSQNATISRIMEASPEENAELIRRAGQPEIAGMTAHEEITKLDIDMSELALEADPHRQKFESTYTDYPTRPLGPGDVPLYPANRKTPYEREQERRAAKVAAPKAGFLSKISKLFGG
jgi:hypothetical protein